MVSSGFGVRLCSVETVSFSGLGVRFAGFAPDCIGEMALEGLCGRECGSGPRAGDFALDGL